MHMHTIYSDGLKIAMHFKSCHAYSNNGWVMDHGFWLFVLPTFCIRITTLCISGRFRNSQRGFKFGIFLHGH